MKGTGRESYLVSLSFKFSKDPSFRYDLELKVLSFSKTPPKPKKKEQAGAELCQAQLS